MHTKKRTVGYLARVFHIHPDEVLFKLWYFSQKSTKFNYLINEGSVITEKHLKLAKDILRKRNETGCPQKIAIYYPEKKAFDFGRVGRYVSPLSFLTTENIIAIHDELAHDFRSDSDPISPEGIKDEHMLHSAVFHPCTSFEGVYKYPTVETSGAALMYSISNNHAFYNGNKRTALVALTVFLDRHGISLVCRDDELFRLSLDVASHKLTDLDYKDPDEEIYALSRWIVQKSKIMKAGERPITFRRLQRILKRFDCFYNESLGGFERQVKSTFNIRKNLSYKLSMGAIKPGEEINKNIIGDLRHILQLDREHGIDTEAFYEGDDYSTGEFIMKYKNVLSRLSRV